MISHVLSKNLHTWMGGYARHLCARAAPSARRQPRHLLFALCDHFEPLWGGVSPSRGDERVRAWIQQYPEMAGEFRDADGRHPRHTFFFPGDQYTPSYVERLATVVRANLGEVELHLHHDGDDSTSLRERLSRHVLELASHGHLSRAPDGRPRYAFIHGNWCLANSRPDGRWCGVDDELSILFDTGCFADFTFPSAPDVSQPNIVNQIYWPTGDLCQARAHQRGRRARVGERKRDRLLLIQGPLALTRRPGRVALRIENGALTAHDPPTADRAATWVKQHIHVSGRPDWIFVKVHTHGAPEDTAASLLGSPGRQFHESLAAYNDGEHWLLHYVTAREMFNIACAAMDGLTGNPHAYRNYLLPPPPVARAVE